MNKLLLTTSALVLGAGVLFSGTVSALAYRGNPEVPGPNYSPERHEAMVQAFENNDYNAWKELMHDRGKIAQVINEENFSRFTEMRRLRLEGKTDEANQIRSELGLGMGGGPGYRHGNGHCRAR